jgi:hypothetical protein
MNAAEIVQHAIRDSRNENRTVHLASDLSADRTSADELFEILLAESDDSIDDQSYQIFWGGEGEGGGGGWQITLYYPYL